MKVRDILEQDLLGIFGVKKVKFNRFEYSREQDILFCDIINTEQYYQDGSKSFKINVELSIGAPIKNMDIGFLMDRYIISRYEFKNRLKINDNEEPIYYKDNGSEFAKCSITAFYIIQVDFNKERNHIKNLKFNIIKK